jgi:phage shock protein PspC (stress-responsive transcriptional regulator)
MYRMRSDAVIFGVCAAVAGAFGLDVRSVRIVVVTLAVLDPLCVVGLVYLLAAALLPPE